MTSRPRLTASTLWCMSTALGTSCGIFCCKQGPTGRIHGPAYLYLVAVCIITCAFSCVAVVQCAAFCYSRMHAPFPHHMHALTHTFWCPCLLLYLRGFPCSSLLSAFGQCGAFGMHHHSISSHAVVDFTSCPYLSFLMLMSAEVTLSLGLTAHGTHIATRGVTIPYYVTWGVGSTGCLHAHAKHEHAAYRPFILHAVNEGAQLPSLGSVCLFVPVR